MKKVTQAISILVLTLLPAVGCSSAEQRSTMTPFASPPMEAPTATMALTATNDQTTPTLMSTAAPTEATPLFSEADGAYTVHLTPADFVDGVDNPYFPLPPGTKWEYEIRESGVAKQMDTLEVLKEKRNVNGIQATVVRDTVSSGNQIVEDTYDWFAQDKYGNVWYVGEAVDNYVAGLLVNHSGSWEWGVDGAQPGIIMWADPSAHVNEKYRQEYYAGKAEDMGQVLSTNESLTVPFGSFDDVVKTLDFSNIESGQEQKFYAPATGLLRELDVNGNEEMVLVNMTGPGQ